MIPPLLGGGGPSLSTGSLAWRVFAGGLATGALFGALWGAGLLAPSARPDSGAGVRPLVLDPDTALQTPGSEVRSVGLRPGELAPDFAFSGYNGERRRLSDFRGRPVVLNFWASWCAPCRSEMAALEDAIARHAGAGLVVVAVNNGESYAAGLTFLDREGISLTAFAVDVGGDIASRYGVFGMPSTYFIGPDGVISGVVAGRLDRTRIDDAVGSALGADYQVGSAAWE